MHHIFEVGLWEQAVAAFLMRCPELNRRTIVGGAEDDEWDKKRSAERGQGSKKA